MALNDADANAPDHQVDLEPGTNTVKVRVTDSNAMTATYTLILIRAPPLDLTALALADGAGNAIALDPAFAAATRDYTARVAHGVEFATVGASAHAVARVEVTPADAGPARAGPPGAASSGRGAGDYGDGLARAAERGLDGAGQAPGDGRVRALGLRHECHRGGGCGGHGLRRSDPGPAGGDYGPNDGVRERDAAQGG